ncbi:uncharacterized protein LOC126388653, partial [Scomber scombrus]
IDISLVLEQYQKLRKLYHIDEADVHGPHVLVSSLEDDSVVVVALIDASGAHGKQGLPKKVSDLTYRSDVSDQQQDQLCALLLKWEKVFSKPDENFWRMYLVQYRINTSDAVPIREWHQPLPTLMYKEMPFPC